MYVSVAVAQQARTAPTAAPEPEDFRVHVSRGIISSDEEAGEKERPDLARARASETQQALWK